MFGRKAKRIRELEQQVKELRSASIIMHPMCANSFNPFVEQPIITVETIHPSKWRAVCEFDYFDSKSEEQLIEMFRRKVEQMIQEAKRA